MCFTGMYVCAPYVRTAHGGQKKALESLELGL